LRKAVLFWREKLSAFRVVWNGAHVHVKPELVVHGMEHIVGRLV
jgi:hypothetical protein